MLEDKGKHKERAGKKRKAEKRINCRREEGGGNTRRLLTANSLVAIIKKQLC